MSKLHEIPPGAAPPADPPPAVVPATVIDDADTVETTVIARNPQEMLAAQGRLIAWATRKIAEAEEEHADLEENLKLCRINKWKPGSLIRQATRAQNRITFYVKIKAALEAGYVIIPNMDMNIFAIRTVRSRPRRNMIQSKERWESNASWPSAQGSDRAPIGEGNYQNPAALTRTRTRELPDPERKEGQKSLKEITCWASAFQDEIDFPFTAAKPEILEATQQAMALRIFDDLGAAPARAKGDPMVIGRISFCGGGYLTRHVSFLITWFIDTRDLSLP